MRILILVAVVCLLGAADAKSRKKSTKDDLSSYEELKVKHKKVPSAILAIEIVDPNENKTSSRNSKRTIESSLGYGYQQPKYEVYKYSQHDIPPYHGPKNVFSGSFSKNSDLVVQKSIEYTLPTQKYIEYDNHQQYQPGTRLYTTLDQQGQISQLSSNAPQGYQGLHVPVVILRVYPNQLTDPGSLHANLPQSHPLSGNINSLDIQSLLSKYLHNHQQQTYQSQEPVFQQPTYQQHSYQQQDYQQQTYQQPEQQYQYETPQSHDHSGSKSELLTHENYPSDSHTRVIFKNNKGQVRKSNRGQAPAQPVQIKTVNIHVPDGIQEVKVETSETPYQAYSSPQEEEKYQAYTSAPEEQKYQAYTTSSQEQKYQAYTSSPQEQKYQHNYYYYQPQQYEQQQEQYPQEQQGYSSSHYEQQYQESARDYSGKPIVVADPQAYEQQYEQQYQQQYQQQQQEDVKPHEYYGQPNVQYESQQQYSSPSDYYAQVQYNPSTYATEGTPSYTKAHSTESSLTYVTPVKTHVRRLRSKKRMAPKRTKIEEEKQ